MPNQGGTYTWSQTAANNSNADLTVNWQPQMAPSAVAPSGRAMMASVAKWRDDISGLLVTSGTSTAYTLASNQIFDSLDDMDGKIVAFTPHVTNGAGPVTLNVDGLNTTAYLRSAPNADLPAGVIIQGTPYVAIFKKSDNAFYLQGFYGQPYVIPIGATLEWWSSTLPNSSFILPYGQAISRTVYSTLFSLWGTYYGTGDGSTTFNVPDLRGRTVVCPDTMGGTDAGRLAGSSINNRGAIGGVGGEALASLVASQIPTIASSGTTSNSITLYPLGNPANNFPITTGSIAGDEAAPQGGPTYPYSSGSWTATSAVQGTVNISANVDSTNTGGSAPEHDNVQPSILANRILRII